MTNLNGPRSHRRPPRGLSADDIRRLLAAIPSTPSGIRDRAIVITLALTGRRRTEVLTMTAASLLVGDPVYYNYRGKGGKQGKRELPWPAFEAIQVSLAAWGKSMDAMAPAESLWPSPSGKGLLDSTFYTNLRRYLKKAGLPPAGVHILRHSAAKLRRDAGESIEDVSRFLDHSSLAVTTTYLRRLEGQQDQGWGAVAAAIGV
ncbi:MAG: site-specific integrase [Chloroflexota bacterium]